ncbi:MULTISPECIES: lysylphosphatidylglycerol synthase transmembrane domain-containing protein [Breznakia]|uniref:Phosphatidylglycerol lysyltransferase n=1 Tax=Breznakia blatticola TaxID=1754012 RepID=A0A4V6Q8K9_9FIRM|nr:MULTISPECIES: lysylphosphatidylglycerol synthase transmembrane domain-containing protein [Breznakia]MDH6367974.1 uncharacterized protein (TIRG00374 family) [Breznakia sp. PH1-1]MDH6405062.1 uncharacterized protein (TIRG00374 family) [Breznakia sp. PF1-11]MDH6412769.1 uncharacterized protein (TIRG00374 family) [Breznakia sp. PFB1-11]MDH6415137.1 uncharacterized protein (TIRG00374 family) [Breznakia sp. PFB1-14]MDH6417440.1 uncharacterized protein (TIRG00374 family) [Breznakia sp. PFB1-4]
MKKQSYAINFLLILGLTAFGLWFALKDHYREVLGMLANLSIVAIIVIFMYGLSYNFIIGWIYKIIGKTYKHSYRYKDGLAVAFVGAFFSGITPSASGGQFAQAYILKQQGLKMSSGLSLLWIDFIIYQSVMVAYTTVLMVLRFTYYFTEQSSFFILVLIGYLINSAVIVFLYTMAKFPKAYTRLSGFVVRLLGKLHIVKHPEETLAKWNVSLNQFTKEIQEIKHKKKMVIKCVALNVLRLTLLYALPLFIAYLMKLDVNIGMLFDVITMSAFVMIANAFLPVPGASGGTEAAFILIFSTLFSGVEANSIMILWRFATYHLIMLVGGMCFIILKRKYDKQKVSVITKEDYHENSDLY